MQRTLGVDPGLLGGLGVLDQDGDGRLTAHCVATPIVVLPKRREYDLGAMAGLLRSLAIPGTTVAIESQGARPGQGVASTFRTGLGVGIWLGLVAGLQLPYEFVQPAAWKRWHGLLGANKRASRLRAQERFPALGVIRAKDEGPAEALLIAAYALARRPKETP